MLSSDQQQPLGRVDLEPVDVRQRAGALGLARIGRAERATAQAMGPSGWPRLQELGSKFAA